MADLVWIKGGGDLATGVAYRLLQSGFRVLITELPQPACVRRAVAFAEAVYNGRHEVEGFTAVLVSDRAEVTAALERGEVPVAVDPTGELARSLSPAAAVDAIMAKRNTGTDKDDAPVVIALGPGFVAGEDCHAVIETQRGHYLGRALYRGSAAPDTGEPGEIGGVKGPRVVRAPAAGAFRGLVEIGAQVRAGDRIGEVQYAHGVVPVTTAIHGVVRGLMHSGCRVQFGVKVGDIDPTNDRSRCFAISDKALAIGGGVLEALLHFRAR